MIDLTEDDADLGLGKTTTPVVEVVLLLRMQRQLAHGMTGVSKSKSVAGLAERLRAKHNPSTGSRGGSIY